MKLQIVKSRVVAELRDNIGVNLPYYRSGDFRHIFCDPSKTIPLDIDIDESKLEELIPSSDNSSEVINCKLVSEAFSSITYYLARDERLWVFMTHSLLLDYSRSRWVIPTDDGEAVKHISAHFFAKEKRNIERDNAVSRLWWQAALCKRVNGLDLDAALSCLLFNSDVRANIIERPTTSQCVNVFSALVKTLHKSYITDKKIFHRISFRELMKKLNLHGGIKLLNAMDEKEILSFIDGNFVYMA